MVMASQKGSTLIEVLVAAIVFALGILGVINSIGQGVHTVADNNERAIAASVASQLAEPLYVAAYEVSVGAITESQFKDKIAALNNLTVVGNDNRDNFTLRVAAAVDDANTDIMNTPPPYQPPLRVALEVKYQGISGAKTTRLNYTFAW